MSQKHLESEITPSEFFEGVAEMRAHLDRNSSPPTRELLTRMAFDLTKPRSFDALCQWFCTTMARALAARGAALLLEVEAAYVMHVTCGVVRAAPCAPGATTVGGTLMPLLGTSAAFGALWVEHEEPLDSSLAALLTAVIDAVAMSLESLRERTC
jgi:hypothetical protein